MTDINRIVVWLSGGVSSAVAAKIATEKYQGKINVELVNTDTGSEDQDNYRFMREVGEWVGLPVKYIRNEKYKNTFEVYDACGFIKNQYGARCTVELKKVPRRLYERLATDLQVFGYDADEKKRAKRFLYDNPEVNAWFPLVEKGINKDMARQMVAQAGIAEPRTYREGFKNANCLEFGCVKGGMGYWNFMRVARPHVFWRMAQKEREIGYAILAYDTVNENGKRIKIPVFLDELDPQAGNYKAEPAFQCGLFCGRY